MRYIDNFLMIISDLRLHCLDHEISVRFTKSGGAELEVMGWNAFFVMHMDHTGYLSGYTIPKDHDVSRLTGSDLGIELILREHAGSNYETFEEAL